VPFAGEPISLAATDLGDHLALGWLEPPSGSAPPRVAVRVLDEGGAVAASASLDLPVHAAGALSLLGSPPGDALLLSWSEGDFPNERVRLARVACDLPVARGVP
jgi:hypothetical protein